MTATYTIEFSDSTDRAIRVAAELFDMTPEAYIRESARDRNRALAETIMELELVDPADIGIDAASFAELRDGKGTER